MPHRPTPSRYSFNWAAMRRQEMAKANNANMTLRATGRTSGWALRNIMRSNIEEMAYQRRAAIEDGFRLP